MLDTLHLASHRLFARCDFVFVLGHQAALLLARRLHFLHDICELVHKPVAGVLPFSHRDLGEEAVLGQMVVRVHVMLEPVLDGPANRHRRLSEGSRLRIVVKILLAQVRVAHGIELGIVVVRAVATLLGRRLPTAAASRASEGALLQHIVLGGRKRLARGPWLYNLLRDGVL